MKTILVPVDLSAASVEVCAAACRLARLIQARVLLLHVVQPAPVLLNEYYAFEAGAMAEAVAAGEKFAARELQVLAGYCHRRGVPVRIKQLVGRQPVEDILAKAASSRAAYVVIGSHGHGAVFELLVGSTAQGVLRRAGCPVLVVPMEGRD